MAGILRVCWNSIPILFAAITLTFTLLVMISGTTTNNAVSDIYFLKVTSSHSIYVEEMLTTKDKYNTYNTSIHSAVRFLPFSSPIYRSPRLLRKLTMGLL